MLVMQCVSFLNHLDHFTGGLLLMLFWRGEFVEFYELEEMKESVFFFLCNSRCVAGQLQLKGYGPFQPLGLFQA